jgi:hypothetical protein
VSDLNKKIYGTIEAWRNRPIEGEHPYVYLDGIVLKRSWAGEVRNASLLVAIGVNGEGYREILGICEGAKEDKAGWSGFLKHLKERGLKGVRLIISDACMGLSESAAEFFPDAAGQSNPGRRGHRGGPAEGCPIQVIEKLHGLRLTRAAEIVETAVEETLAYYYAFPEEHWRRVRTTDEIDKRFFVNRATAQVHSFVRPRDSSFFRPGRRSRSRRAQGRSMLAAFAATTGLALTGSSTAARWRGRDCILRLPASGEARATCVATANLADATVMGHSESRLPHPRVQPEIARQLLWAVEPADFADRRHNRGGDRQIDAGDRHQSVDRGIIDCVLRNLAVKRGQLCHDLRIAAGQRHRASHTG